MFFLIKLFIIAFLALVVFFVPLGSRSLSGHLRAIWSTPESQELKRALTENTLLLEAWIESHRALSGEPRPTEAKPGQADMGSDGDVKVPTPAAMTPPTTAPKLNPANRRPPRTTTRRPRRTRGGESQGETR